MEYNQMVKRIHYYFDYILDQTKDIRLGINILKLSPRYIILNTNLPENIGKLIKFIIKNNYKKILKSIISEDDIIYTRSLYYHLENCSFEKSIECLNVLLTSSIVDSDWIEHRMIACLVNDEIETIKILLEDSRCIPRNVYYLFAKMVPTHKILYEFMEHNSKVYMEIFKLVCENSKLEKYAEILSSQSQNEPVTINNFNFHLKMGIDFLLYKEKKIPILENISYKKEYHDFDVIEFSIFKELYNKIFDEIK